MLPPELLTPNNLLSTAFVGIGLALGAAIVYVRKNLLTPTQTKTTDLIIAGGQVWDPAKLDDFKKDVKRMADALEQMAALSYERSRAEALEEKIMSTLDAL